MSENDMRPYPWGKFTAPGDVAGMAQAEGGREGHVQIPEWQGDDEVIDMSAPLDDDGITSPMSFAPPSIEVEKLSSIVGDDSAASTQLKEVWITNVTSTSDDVDPIGRDRSNAMGDAKIVEEHLGQHLGNRGAGSDTADEILGNRSERVAAVYGLDSMSPKLLRDGSDGGETGKTVVPVDELGEAGVTVVDDRPDRVDIGADLGLEAQTDPAQSLRNRSDRVQTDPAMVDDVPRERAQSIDIRPGKATVAPKEDPTRRVIDDRGGPHIDAQPPAGDGDVPPVGGPAPDIDLDVEVVPVRDRAANDDTDDIVQTGRARQGKGPDHEQKAVDPIADLAPAGEAQEFAEYEEVAFAVAPAADAPTTTSLVTNENVTGPNLVPPTIPGEYDEDAFEALNSVEDSVINKNCQEFEAVAGSNDLDVDSVDPFG